MSDYEISRVKQIEDIIDAKKWTGHYDIDNIHSQNLAVSRNLLCRNTYSVPSIGNYEAEDVTVWNDDPNLCNCPTESEGLNIGPTDSEITVVRVKRRGMRNRPSENKWNLTDNTIAGDGTHLAESPSLINLVTFVKDHYCEYFVPLSSWDPTDNPHELSTVKSEGSCFSATEPSRTAFNLDYGPASTGEEDALNVQLKVIKGPNNKHLGLAGKISNFLRKRVLKSNNNNNKVSDYCDDDNNNNVELEDFESKR